MGKLNISIKSQKQIISEWIVIFGLYRDLTIEDVQEALEEQLDGNVLYGNSEDYYETAVIRFLIDKAEKKQEKDYFVDYIAHAFFAARHGRFVAQDERPVFYWQIFPCYWSELQRYKFFSGSYSTLAFRPGKDGIGKILVVYTMLEDKNGESIGIDKIDVAYYDGLDFRRINGRKLAFKPTFFQYLGSYTNFDDFQEYLEPVMRIDLISPEKSSPQDN